MPNRLIREGFLDSERIDALSADSERLYHRLLLACDDAGRFDGRPAMIAARCFPLRRDVRAVDVARWVEDCTRQGLLIPYEFNGSPFIQVTRWQSTGNAAYSKFPWSNGSFTIELVDLVTRDGPKKFVTTSVPHADGILTPSESPSRASPTETKTETKTDTKSETMGSAAAPRTVKGVEIPPSLRTPEFLAAWKVWEQHLMEKRISRGKTADQKQLAKCEEWGPAYAVECIDHSIAGSYQSIYPAPAGQRKSTNGTPHHRSPAPAGRGGGRAGDGIEIPVTRAGNAASGGATAKAG